MAAKEIYDYVPTVTPDKDVTLSIHPTVPPIVDIPEEVDKKDIIHVGDDGSEERMSHGGGLIFKISISWNALSEEDAGTVLDFWADSNKGNGRVNSFKYNHYDGHTYVVRFDSKMTRRRIFAGATYGIDTIVLRVLGRIEDV